MKEFNEEYIKEEIVRDNNKYKKDVFDSNLQVELNDRKNIEKYGYDFVPRVEHWTNLEEQKIDVDKIEKITKN